MAIVTPEDMKRTILEYVENASAGVPSVVIDDVIELLGRHFDEKGWPDDEDMTLEYGIALLDRGSILAGCMVEGVGTIWRRAPGESDWVME